MLILSRTLFVCAISMMASPAFAAGTFDYLPKQPANGLPTVADKVIYKNAYCEYQDVVPFVKSVNWTHPKVKAAMRKLGPAYRSVIGSGDWKAAYLLENDRDLTDETQRRNVASRNFMRILCGEFRDYPKMLEAKLQQVIDGQHYASADEMVKVDTRKNLFTQITYPAYRKMVNVMEGVHASRQAKIKSPKDGYNYNFKAMGHNSHRVENSVAPFTHCEMKFMFEKYMTKGAPSFSAAAYEAAYAAYQKSSCVADDFAWMYNFRGHKNFKPLEYESNGNVWNSYHGNKIRKAREAAKAPNANEYYLHPFAIRNIRSRQALGAYVLYPDADHQYMAQASERGGGPIMYVTDTDLDKNGLADYRLFRDTKGCGDGGLAGNDPDQNCNMVSWERAASERDTTGSAAGWSADWFWQPDMGLFQTFKKFEDRMARINIGLDRHTNWGPTSYYMLNATKAGSETPEYRGAYSPFVACSYDISASAEFAAGDYPTTEPFEAGKTKWMFIMKFPAKNYYSEKDLAAGKPLDWNRHYLNETSLSNDYYSERALDKFGFVAPEEIHANVYFPYGANGVKAADIDKLFVDIPAPAPNAK